MCSCPFPETWNYFFFCLRAFKEATEICPACAEQARNAGELNPRASDSWQLLINSPSSQPLGWENSETFVRYHFPGFLHDINCIVGMIKHSFLATFPSCYHFLIFPPVFPVLLQWTACTWTFSWRSVSGENQSRISSFFPILSFLLPVNYQVLIIPVHHHLENLATSLQPHSPFPGTQCHPR